MGEKKSEEPMLVKEICTNWKMHTAGQQDWQEAVVPGSVYTDLYRNGNIADPYWKDYACEQLSLMEQDYEYETEFACGHEIQEYERVFLRFEGIDTLADIFLNGVFIGTAENMHRTWEYAVKDSILPGKNKLTVRLHSPLKYIRSRFAQSPVRGCEDAMDGFVHLRKAHCMFGWDWGAHLPDQGIFKKVFLTADHGIRIKEVRIHQDHSKESVMLHLNVMTEGDDQPNYQVVLKDPDGNVCCYKDSPSQIPVEHPQLWWPNGLGKQPLYTLRVDVLENGSCQDCWERNIGLRTITVTRNKDQWGESFAHCINGKEVFAMGADYIPEDHLLGRTSRERTRRLLEDCKAAHFNTIRVWGGGYYPQDWFFDLCDELGLMVWQDFMFACAMYELTPEFEENITKELTDNIIRIRHHACLALWCGNNEMEMFTKRRLWVSHDWEIRDYLILYERIIPGVLKEYDPDHFYWPASPSSGGSFDEPNDPDRGDVHFWDVWHGDKPFTEYRKYYFRYVSEFGFQSFPCFSTVKTFTDDEEDWNIFSYVMERHQRNGSANGKIMNYMQQTYKYPTSFKLVLYASQLLQADAVRYGVEHFRRNRGRCMGAIYWQLNDCWPVASWSSIDYTNRWKALHYAAKRFFAPIMISCEEEGWLTQEIHMNNEHFKVDKSIRLNVANETFQEEKLIVRWAVRDNDANVKKQEEQEVTVPPLSSVWLEKQELPHLDLWKEYVSYEVCRGTERLSSGTVIFSLPKYFKYKNPNLTYETGQEEIVIKAEAYARSVEVQNEDETLVLSDNYFDMNAGEKRVRVIRGNLNGLRLRSVYDIR